MGPTREEKIKQAEAILDEKDSLYIEEGAEVLFTGNVDDCPKSLLNQIEEQVKNVSLEDSDEKMVTEMEVESAENKIESELDDSFEMISENEERSEAQSEKASKVQDEKLNDSFEQMFSQHEKEFNSQFGPGSSKSITEIIEGKNFHSSNSNEKSSNEKEPQNEVVKKSIDQKKKVKPISRQRKVVKKSKSVIVSSVPKNQEVALEFEKLSNERIKMFADFLEKERTHVAGRP